MNTDFNVILDDLPAKHGGVVFNVDFRQGLKYFRILGNKDMSDAVKAKWMIKAMVKTFDVSRPEAIFKEMGWFLSCGEVKEDQEESKKLFDFCKDSGYLYSAFYQVYKIDLRRLPVYMPERIVDITNHSGDITRQERRPEQGMHWWQFMSLFKGLPDSTKLASIIEIRGKKPPKGADKEYKRELAKIQRAYALEDDNSSEQALINFFDRW